MTITIEQLKQLIKEEALAFESPQSDDDLEAQERLKAAYTSDEDLGIHLPTVGDRVGADASDNIEKSLLKLLANHRALAKAVPDLEAWAGNIEERMRKLTIDYERAVRNVRRHLLNKK